jgi:hypothetical protein
VRRDRRFDAGLGPQPIENLAAGLIAAAPAVPVEVMKITPCRNPGRTSVGSSWHEDMDDTMSTRETTVP